MYFIQKLGDTKLQVVTITVGLIAGILAFGSFLHLSIIFWNYEYTYPEDLFIFYQSRVYNKTMYEVFTDFKKRIYNMCNDSTYGLVLAPNRRSALDRSLDLMNEDSIWEMDNVRIMRDTSSKYKMVRKAERFQADRTPVENDPEYRLREEEKETRRNFQLLQREMKEFRKQRSQRRRGFRSRFDILSSYQRARLPTGIKQIDDIEPGFGGFWHEDHIVMRAEKSTEAQNRTEKCTQKAHLETDLFNQRLNVGRAVAIGNVEDLITSMVMMLQLIIYTVDIAFIVSNTLLILGAAMLRSTYVLPWMAFWWPFVIIHLFYMWVMWYLYTEMPYGLTPFAFFIYFVVLILVIVLGLILFWLVWCFYLLLLTPEAYMEQMSSISQLVVTGRNIRG